MGSSMRFLVVAKPFHRANTMARSRKERCVGCISGFVSGRVGRAEPPITNAPQAPPGARKPPGPSRRGVLPTGGLVSGLDVLSR